MDSRMKRALTIAGSDSGGGAGIQADLKTFMAFGVYGASAITAITSQNTLEVKSILPVTPKIVEDQMEAVLDDLGADAVKTGMLFSEEIVESVASVLRKHKPPHLVVDPVMISKSGAELLEPDARAAVVNHLFPLSEVVTPNVPEAEAILGSPVQDFREAARALHALGPCSVILKGGHREGETIVDLLYDGRDFLELEGTRIDTVHTHGTGCTLSAALAAGLALGWPVETAFATARDYVIKAIRTAPGLGSGSGPLNHGVTPEHGEERT